ncbi:uncharacterized protein DEA37_0013537 [Paragonimus westermani]|uniref:Uncharacterized protein n=1 Tax=Paragonimus westermani TaxID=34504 RepID=A0A5J4NGZ7_9TREM|nr:uncharacterized protein DEA37_0013537 [Paragonimus westermani]
MVHLIRSSFLFVTEFYIPGFLGVMHQPRRQNFRRRGPVETVSRPSLLNIFDQGNKTFASLNNNTLDILDHCKPNNEADVNVRLILLLSHTVRLTVIRECWNYTGAQISIRILYSKAYSTHGVLKNWRQRKLKRHRGHMSDRDFLTESTKHYQHCVPGDVV